MVLMIKPYGLLPIHIHSHSIVPSVANNFTGSCLVRGFDSYMNYLDYAIFFISFFPALGPGWADRVPLLDAAQKIFALKKFRH